MEELCIFIFIIFFLLFLGFLVLDVFVVFGIVGFEIVFVEVMVLRRLVCESSELVDE